MSDTLTFYLFRDRSRALCFKTIPNSYFFDFPSSWDQLDKNLKGKVDKLIESTFRDIEDEYDEVLEYILNHVQLTPWEKSKDYLSTRLFSKNIEDYATPVRQYTYLKVIKHLQEKKINLRVTTDVKAFAILMWQNQIECNFIKSNNPKKQHFRSLILQIVLKIKAKTVFSNKNINILTIASNWMTDAYDRHYGSLSDAKFEFNYVFYLTSLSQFKKIPKNSIMANCFISFFSLITILFNSSYLYLYCFFVMKKSMNFKTYILGGWIRELLKEDSLTIYVDHSIYKHSILAFLKSLTSFHKSENVLLNYGELFPLQRWVNLSIRQKYKDKIKIVSIQHAMNFKAKLVNYEKQVIPIMESPHNYLVHGQYFSKPLLNYYSGLISVIGCLKYKDISFGNSPARRRILFLPSLNDIDVFIDLLSEFENNDFFSYELFISKHPAYDLFELKKKIATLNLEIKIADNNSRDFSKSCDFIVFCYSSAGFESLFFGKKIIRIFSPKLPKLFDDDLRIPTVSAKNEFINLINDYKDLPVENIIWDYFNFPNPAILDDLQKELT